MPASSLIIGVDLDPIRAIPKVKTFVGDITTQKCRTTLRSLLGGAKESKGKVDITTSATSVLGGSAASACVKRTGPVMLRAWKCPSSTVAGEPSAA
jgi:23S rRNA U2552 (ribose-2'-O)-methylase RlmE/FtsJ